MLPKYLKHLEEDDPSRILVHRRHGYTSYYSFGDLTTAVTVARCLVEQYENYLELPELPIQPDFSRDSIGKLPDSLKDVATKAWDKYDRAIRDYKNQAALLKQYKQLSDTGYIKMLFELRDVGIIDFAIEKLGSCLN